MSFCVECGATVETIHGVCPNCFLERHKVIEPPENIDVVRCTTCSKFQIGKAWVDTDIDGALMRLLEKSIPVAKEVSYHTFTFDVRPEDERNMTVVIKAMLRVEDIDLMKSFRTRLRIHGGTCPTCGRKAGFYYEAILQVRADRRAFSDDEMVEFVEFAERLVARASSTSKTFISKTEPVKGGIDFYLSSHDLGRNLAKEFRMKYGGTVGVSPRLYGLKDGKEVYRTTHLVRLPRYREGDIVRMDGRLLEVLSMGLRPTLRDLKSGDTITASGTRMDRAKVVPSERFSADVISLTGKEVEYYDPAELKNLKVSRPPHFRDAKKVDIVKIADVAFVSMFRTAVSGKSR